MGSGSPPWLLPYLPGKPTQGEATNVRRGGTIASSRKRVQYLRSREDEDNIGIQIRCQPGFFRVTLLPELAAGSWGHLQIDW